MEVIGKPTVQHNYGNISFGKKYGIVDYRIFTLKQPPVEIKFCKPSVNAPIMILQKDHYHAEGQKQKNDGGEPVLIPLHSPIHTIM